MAEKKRLGGIIPEKVKAHGWQPTKSEVKDVMRVKQSCLEILRKECKSCVLIFNKDDRLIICKTFDSMEIKTALKTETIKPECRYGSLN